VSPNQGDEFLSVARELRLADAADPAERDKTARHLAQLKALQDALGAGTVTSTH